MNRKLIGAALALMALVGTTMYLSGGPEAFAQGTPQVNTPVQIHGGKQLWHWRNAGAKPFIPFNGLDGKPIPREQRRKTAEASDRKVLEAQGVPSEVGSCLIEKIALHPDGDTIFYAKDGMRYLGITYGGPSITKNAVVAFGSKVPEKDDKRKVAEWSCTDKETSRIWTYDRFAWWCINSGIKMVAAKRTTYVPLEKPNCYRVYYDYTGQSDVDKEDGGAHFEVRLDITRAQMEHLASFDCFSVHDDALGDRKPILGCDCEQGGYPDKDLATANGLPAKEPEGIFHWVGATKGSVSYPIGFYHAGLYCVRVDAYSPKTSGFEAFHAFSRFDIVPGADMRATQRAGKLGWTLTGPGRF